MAELKLVEFFRQVKQEAKKVTWSSRKDVMVSTSVVLVMVLVASVFFLIVDSVIFKTVQMILGL